MICSGLNRTLAALLCILVVSGCGRHTENDVAPRTATQDVQPADSLDDIRNHMASLIRVEDERYLVTSPDEFDSWRLKALSQLDEVRRREGVAGFQQTPLETARHEHGAVDPASHKISWRALTCWNPPCLGKGKSGGPLVFVKVHENASIGPDGRLQWRTLSDQEQTSPAACPLCGRVEFVQPYDAPEVEARRQQLTKELSDSRRIRAEVEAAKGLVPAGVRTPTEIMKELAELPKLYLTPGS